jgi:hypothetical protein
MSVRSAHARTSPALLILAACLLGPGGCASRPSQTRSGFLFSYEDVRRINDAESGYLDKELLASITALRIVETRVLVDKTPDGSVIPPEDIALIEAHIRSALEKSLAPAYTLVEEDGPGVGRLRVAVTEVKKPTVILNLHPASKLTGAGLGGATVESEVIDAKSGRPAAILIESRKGDQFEIDTLSEFDDALDAVEAWAAAWRKRLDSARGIAPPKNSTRN